MRDLVLEHLAAILGSDSFARSARRKAILTYLVERALDNPTAEFSAADISAAVYGRTGDDPDRDTVVRVEMARVRSGLDSWYAGNGWNSPVRISIPKGSYQPVFEFAAKTDPPAEPQPARRPIPKWAPWSLGALVLLAALAAVAWRTIPRRGSEETMLWLPGAMRQPTTSPDGGRIAFVWDGDRGRADIFLNRLGTQRVDRLTDGPEPNVSPAWSPDGATIAFQRRVAPAERAIYLIPAEAGKNPERLLTTIHTAVAGLAWTPDSKHLIVPDSAAGVPLGLHLVAVASGQRQPLVEGLNAFHPTVSPDGRTLAFLADQEHRPRVGLYTLPLSPGFRPAGPARLLADTLAPGVVAPKWSLDGRWIYYVVPGGIVMRCSAATGKVERMVDFPERVVTPLEIAPGRFLTMRNRRRQFLARMKDNAPPEAAFATVDEDMQPDLSPDGKRVVFVSSRGGKPSLWFADTDGRNAAGVSTPGPPSLPRWSPDSREAAFTVALGGHSRIYIASPGGTARPLPFGGEDDSVPFYSRDGRRLYFASHRDGTWRIWRAVLPDGKPEPVSGAPAEHGDESADGRSLFYVSKHQLYRMRLEDRKVEPMGALPMPAYPRATADGLYVEVNTGVRDTEVWFQPFDPRQPRRVFAPGMPISGWSPAEGGILLGLGRMQSELQRFDR